MLTSSTRFAREWREYTARGNAPFVLGREGSFDFFNVTFDKVTRQTVLWFVEP